MFAGSCRFARSLHQLIACIFKLSIPSASSSYATCISATFAPGYRFKFSREFARFPLTTLYGTAGGGDVCRIMQVSALIAPIERLHF